MINATGALEMLAGLVIDQLKGKPIHKDRCGVCNHTRFELVVHTEDEHNCECPCPLVGFELWKSVRGEVS